MRLFFDETVPTDVNELASLLSLPISSGEWKRLRKKAFEFMKKVWNGKIAIRALLEISNVCRRNCYYCGMRRDNKSLERFRFSEDKIIEVVVRSPYSTAVIQAAEDSWLTCDRVANILREIRKRRPDIAITLSLGEQTEDTYKAWKVAGADRYLLKFETFDDELFKHYHPEFEGVPSRKEALLILKKLGYQTGTGFLIGLPGQDMKDFARGILWIAEHKFEMIAHGPFLPAAGTPLGDYEPDWDWMLEMCMKLLILSRLAVPWAGIPATTAVYTRYGFDALVELVRCGANVAMQNFTSSEHGGKYYIYPDKKSITLEVFSKVAEEFDLKVSTERMDMFKPDNVDQWLNAAAE